MKKLLIALGLLSAGSAYAQMPTVEQVYAENDKNKGGIITKQEAMEAGSLLVGFFDMVDTNHDGKVDYGRSQSDVRRWSARYATCWKHPS